MMRQRRLLPFLAAAILGGPLLAVASEGISDSRRRFDDLRAALEAALDAGPAPKARKALLAAHEIVLSPGIGLEPRTIALGKASRLLERRSVARPDLVGEAGAALDGLLGDVEWEYGSLSSRIDALPAAAGLRLRALVESRVARARSGDPERPSRAARTLLSAVKGLRKLRVPSSANYGGPLRVVSFEPPTGTLIGLNQPLTVRFSAPLLPSSVRPDTLQVRIGPNFQSQAAGTYEVLGNIVLFHPSLPTLLDGSGGALPTGTKIRVTTVGFPSTNHLSSRTGQTLDRTLTAEVTTAATGGLLYDYLLYPDAPPARLRETWPVDALPGAPWDGPGGAVDAPTTVEPVLRLSRTPLDPTTLAGRVHLFVANLRGTPILQEVPGTPVLDQDESEVLLSFLPSVELADDSVYFLRLDSGITDLSGQFDLAPHAGRAALQAAATAEFQAGGGPLADLAAALPWAVDSRTYLVFTTGDAPAADRLFTLRFDGTDPAADGGDGSDPARTTASFNGKVPGAVAATVAAAGGDGHLGDFHPLTNTTLDTGSAQAEGGVFQFGRIEIPAGVTVTLTGPLPAVLRASRGVVVDGTLRASGSAGFASEANYNTANLPTQPGGAGGPGGGVGGTNSKNASYGLPGDAGGSVPGGGGGGGGGYETSAADDNSFAGGGGGGGHRYEGVAGGRGTWNPSTSTYNADGGGGGAAGGTEPDSEATLAGADASGTAGAGGGAGGNSHYRPASWRTSGAGGGGGGGSLLVVTSGDLRVSGVLEARGGAGGSSSAATANYSGAPGGGGAGGSVALYASGAVDLSGASIDVSGGAGGVPLGWAGAGGAGSAGWVRVESGTGDVAGLGAATLLPDYAAGAFDPAATVTDPPTVFTSAWFDLGALDPEILPFGPERFVDQEVPGCTVAYEIQMAAPSTPDTTKPDTGALDGTTGDGTDPARASLWVPLKSTAGGILDPRFLLNGHGYRFLRVRITFTLKVGQRASEGLPFVDELRIPFRVQGG